jgi:hypothetical protein
LVEKIKYFRWEPYEEQYFFLLEDMYDIVDGMQASDKPSKWRYTTEGMKGHDMGLK